MLRRTRSQITQNEIKPLDMAKLWLQKNEDPPGFNKVFIDEKIGIPSSLSFYYF